jgi:ATP-dependent Clp protease ATP-binding subunit ClpA
MFERFTARARWVVTAAETEASGLGHEYIGTEHLLLAMLRDTGMANGVLTGMGLTYDGVHDHIKQMVGPGQLGPEDAEALSAIGIDLDAVRANMEENFGDSAVGGRRSRQRIPFSRRAKKVLALSLREAISRKHNYIGTEHLLLALIRDGEGLAAKAITDSGVSLSDLRDATVAAMTRAA